MIVARGTAESNSSSMNWKPARPTHRVRCRDESTRTRPQQLRLTRAFRRCPGEPSKTRLSRDDLHPGGEPAPALQGRDLIAQAKTGSGKTAAYALPLLAKLVVRRFTLQALVLCPTRELAEQVTAEIRRLARAEENVKVVTLVGGAPLRGQTASLEHGAHVAVGTPGRVIDHLERGHLSLDALETLVLDEADRMLDMGFT
ncbi:MAG: hypothetical protein RL458_2364, partial [Pseudomonadota bacterium]